MSIDVDQLLLERALAILRESGDYRDLKLNLDEYFQDDGWADTADSGGPFALAFTRNVEDEGGWLPQGDLATFWDTVARADPEQPSTADDFHRLLRDTIEAWQNAPPDPAGDGPAEFQSVTDMTDANYAGWQQGYDPDEQVWKYRDPDDGLWRESHEAFPLVAPGSRIFRIGERTLVSDGTAEWQVWAYPDIADTYYDADDTYDLLGNVMPPVTEAAEADSDADVPAAAEADSGAGKTEVTEAELERELRELFEVPPDSPVWVSPA
jgi:hypothetical protein